MLIYLIFYLYIKYYILCLLQFICKLHRNITYIHIHIVCFILLPEHLIKHGNLFGNGQKLHNKIYIGQLLLLGFVVVK